MDHIAHQALLSMGFSRQEYWSGLPFPFLGGLLEPGIETASPTLSGRFFATMPYIYIYPLPLEPPFYPPHPTSLGHHGASSWELPVLDSSFPLAICFSYGSIYMPMLLFQLIPPSPSLTEGRHVFQTSTIGLMSDWIRGIWRVLLLYAWTAPTSHSL